MNYNDVAKNNEAAVMTDYSQYPVHPWVRYFARMLDMVCFGLIAGYSIRIIAMFLFPKLTSSFVFENDLAFGIMLLGLWVPVESILLNQFGTTLGKYALNIKVKSADGNNLIYSEALKRSAYVYVIGIGLGLPIVSLATMLYAYLTLRDKRTTKWDEKAKSIVLHGKIDGKRIIILVVMIILLILI